MCPTVSEGGTSHGQARNVCVIGAGVARPRCREDVSTIGHRITILERSRDLGGVWEPARSYPDVQTQSPKELYRYTDKPMPDSYPEWPKGPQVHAYLTDYAKEHGLLPHTRFNATVISARRNSSGRPGWLLEIRKADGGVTHEAFDFVAVCTGQFNERQTIDHPGADAFQAAAAASCIPRNIPTLPPSREEGRCARRVEIRNRYCG